MISQIKVSEDKLLHVSSDIIGWRWFSD